MRVETEEQKKIRILELELKIANNENKHLKKNIKDLIKVAKFNHDRLNPYKAKAEGFEAYYKWHGKEICNFVNCSTKEQEKDAFIVNCAICNMENKL